MSIEQAIISIAINDQQVNAMIDGRISFNEAHELTKTPYITVDTTSASAESLLSSDTNIIREFTQFNLFSATKEEQAKLVRAVKSSFVRVKNYTDQSGTVILDSQLIDYTDLSNRLDLNLYHKVIDIEFVYRDL